MRSQVVEDNQINQQIALKTIKKLGFSVNAVWNGKEALGLFLLTPSNPRHANVSSRLPTGRALVGPAYAGCDSDGCTNASGTVPPCYDAPCVCHKLTQLQLDGYRATQIIRNYKPFNNAPFIPIVAMTASAIQGDKEKCHRAGMDDYLAKPVKGKILESMLVKWAIHGKKQRAAEGSASQLPWQNKEPGTNGDYFANQSNALRPSISHSGDSMNDITMALSPSSTGNTPASSRNASDEHLNSPSDLVPTRSGDARETRLRRAEAEERAIALRDDKLLDAAENPRLQRHASDDGRPRAPKLALTEANVDKLVDEQTRDEQNKDVCNAVPPRLGVNDGAMDSSSSLLAQGRSSFESSRPVSEELTGVMQSPKVPSKLRPGSKRHESEKTITPGSPRLWR